MSSSIENPLGRVVSVSLILMEVVLVIDKWLERCRCEGCPQVLRPSDLSAISKSCRGLTSVWVSKWVLRLDLWLKVRWQMGHLWGESSMCKIRCTARVRDWQNPLPHSLHLKGFSSEWIFMCAVHAFLWAYFLSHCVHEKGLSSVWTCVLCLVSWIFWTNPLSQISQWQGFSLLWVSKWVFKYPFVLKLLEQIFSQPGNEFDEIEAYQVPPNRRFPAF